MQNNNTPKTSFENFKDKIEIMESLIKHINKDEIDQEFLDNYDKLEYACEVLADKIDDFHYIDLGTMKPRLIDDFYKDKLLEAYQEVANATEYFKQFYYGEDSKTIFATITKSIDEFVSSDIKALFKVTTPDTLENIISNGRKKVIDITGQNVKNVGANMSSRQIINVNENQKGVFTPAVKYDANFTLKSNLDSFIDKHPEYLPIFEFLYRKENIGKLDIYSLPQDRTNKTVDMNLNTTIRNSLPKLYENIMKDAEIKDLYNTLSLTDGFNEIMFSFFTQTSKAYTNYKINTELLKVGKDENIDDRNSAMSIMAGLLGVDNILAHSEPVTIVNNGVKVEGTLMNFASGKDVFNLDIDDPMRNGSTKNKFVTADVKKQLCNLQILDFICGNIDRHTGNMFYQFDETDPKKPIFNGIVGIDNDSTFGQLSEKQCKQGFSRMVGLDDQFLIDEDMAKKISGLTPAMIKVSLQGLKMSEAAIESACNRLKMVQEKLANSKDLDMKNPDGTTFNIVTKEQWEKLTIQGLAKATKNSYFKNVQGIFNLVKNVDYMKDDINRDMMDVKIRLMHELKPLDNSLDESNREIASGKKKFRGSSKQYNDIQTLGLALREKAQTINYNSPDDKINEFVNKLKESKEKVQEYLDRKYEEAHPSDPKKKGKVFGSYTQNRIDIMKRYLINLETKETNIKKILSKKTELQSLEANVDRKLADQAQLAKELAANLDIDNLSKKNEQVQKDIAVEKGK